MKPLSNFTLLFVVLFGCLTTCFAIDNNDIDKSTKEDDPKADLPKLTAEQILDHLEFWIGKWEGYDKTTNEIFDRFESKWKEKGKSLAFEGIWFEDGEKKDPKNTTIPNNN